MVPVVSCISAQLRSRDARRSAKCDLLRSMLPPETMITMPSSSSPSPKGRSCANQDIHWHVLVATYMLSRLLSDCDWKQHAQNASQSNNIIRNIDRRKFRSQTSDNMDRWKAEMGRVIEEKKRRKRKSQQKEDPGARKGRKVAKHCVFPMIWGCGGSKSRLAKAAGAEPAGQMRDEKLHAVVARSTCRSQNVQNTPAPDHFWKLRRRKSACRCGAKHISKSKCTKHTRSGPLLEVEMSEKCTPLWREAHFEVKMHKTHQVRITFGSCDVEKVHAVVARSTFRSQHVKSTRHSDHFWTFRCRFARQAQGIVHFVKSEQNARVLWHFQKRWQAWGIWRGSAKMHFRGRRSTLDRWTGKIAKHIGTRLSALHSTLNF